LRKARRAYQAVMIADGKDRGGYGGEVGREDERHGGKATGQPVGQAAVMWITPSRR
jgi:hypothetical protein